MPQYKEITVEEAESLFDAAVKGVECKVREDDWAVWCQRGYVGDRTRYFSPVEMLYHYQEVRYRVEVE